MLGSIPPVQEESVKRKGNKKDMEEISDVVMRYKRKVSKRKGMETLLECVALHYCS